MAADQPMWGLPRPITSAPLDGTLVLAWSKEDGWFTAHYVKTASGGYWCFGSEYYGESPTHWLPLPESPDGR